MWLSFLLNSKSLRNPLFNKNAPRGSHCGVRWILPAQLPQAWSFASETLCSFTVLVGVDFYYISAAHLIFPAQFLGDYDSSHFIYLSYNTSFLNAFSPFYVNFYALIPFELVAIILLIWLFFLFIFAISGK